MRIDDIRVRRGTTAEWLDENPPLNPGEVALEFTADNRVRLKFGTENADFWLDTPYLDAWLAPLSSPQFTDEPEAPTPDGSNTAQIANVEFVQQQIADIDVPTVDNATTSAAGVVQISKTPSGTPKAVGANESLYVQGIKTKYLADYADFAAAITSIGATPTELIVADTVNVTTNTTTPQNILVKPQGNAIFNISSGVTLQIGKLAPVGNRQLFTGAGTARLSIAAVDRINITWWTGTYIGVPLPAAKAITDALVSTTNNLGGIIYFPNGTYTTAGGHELKFATVIEGDGMSPGGIGGSTIKLTGSGSIFPIKTNAHGCVVRNINLVGSNAVTPVGIGVHPNDVTGGILNGLQFDRVAFKDLAQGVYIQSLDSNSWQVEQVEFKQTNFINCTHGVRCNTVNGTITMYQPYSLMGYGQIACFMEKVGMFECINHHFAGTNPGVGETRLDKNAYCVFHFGYTGGIGSEHASIHISGGQDEGFYHSMIVNSYDYLKPIVVTGTTMQGLVSLNGNCVLLSLGNCYIAEAIRDKATFFSTGSPVSVRVCSILDTAGAGIDGTGHYRNIEGDDFGTNIANVPIHEFVSPTSSMPVQVTLNGIIPNGDLPLNMGVKVPQGTAAYNSGTNAAILDKTAGIITGVNEQSWSLFSTYITPTSLVFCQIRTGTSLNNLSIAKVAPAAGYADITFNQDPSTLTPNNVDVSFFIVNPS